MDLCDRRHQTQDQLLYVPFLFLCIGPPVRYSERNSKQFIVSLLSRRIRCLVVGVKTLYSLCITLRSALLIQSNMLDYENRDVSIIRAMYFLELPLARKLCGTNPFLVYQSSASLFPPGTTFTGVPHSTYGTNALFLLLFLPDGKNPLLLGLVLEHRKR